MATASIPVDLLNPGQVFGCIGLAEIARVLHGESRGAFDWTDRRGVRFVLGTPSNEDPIKAALGFLDAAEVVSLAPATSGHRSEKPWGVPTQPLPIGAPFPNYDGQKAAQLPGRLRCGHHNVDISYWGDSMAHIGRDSLKFWGGSQGKPGVSHVNEALASVRGNLSRAHGAPFELSAFIGSNLRLDWRGSGVPLDMGFAMNNHKSKGWGRVNFPLVEVLAAVGLAHARPQFVQPLKYRYGVISGAEQPVESLLPLPLLRAAIGAARLPFPQRRFTMHLGKVSDYDRAITSSVEEFSL